MRKLSLEFESWNAQKHENVEVISTFHVMKVESN